MKNSLCATFAAACLTLAAVGCEGTDSSPAVTPVGGNGGANVDVETGEPGEADGRGVHVNVGGGRVDVGAGGVDVNVDGDGVRVNGEGAERRERRRERIGEALENLNVDVDAGGVKVDVN